MSIAVGGLRGQMAVAADDVAQNLSRLGHVPREGRSEPALLTSAAAGDEAALAELFRVHWPRAYRVALLIVHDHAAAEDVAQDAFLAAVRRLDRFDRSRRFEPWLMKIVSNRAIDWTRARGVRREVAHDGEEVLSEFAPARVASPPCSDEVLSALAALPVEQRAVVVLRYLLDYRPGEIARILEVPRGTVNSRLRRGLDALGLVLREGTA